MESLRGIFPSAPQVHKRDFLKENVMKIRNIQRMRKPTNKSEYSNKFDKPRKLSLCENISQRSTHSLALKSTKAPILRKSVSEFSIQSSSRSTQTCDTNGDFFLKDSIIRYPSASTIRSITSARSPSAHNRQRSPNTCSRGHQMEPEERPRFNSHFHDSKDEHCEKMERHITNLSEFQDQGSISKKKPSSILKNSSCQKSSKNYINEYQRKENRGNLSEESKPISVVVISDDDDDIQMEKLSLTENKGQGDAKKQEKLKAAAEDPNCPEGHVPLSENERMEALKLAQKQFKELVDDLNRLPMTAETLRVRNCKIKIEKELRELEKNIMVFSRTKVYVKLD